MLCSVCVCMGCHVCMFMYMVIVCDKLPRALSTTIRWCSLSLTVWIYCKLSITRLTYSRHVWRHNTSTCNMAHNTEVFMVKTTPPKTTFPQKQGGGGYHGGGGFTMNTFVQHNTHNT